MQPIKEPGLFGGVEKPTRKRVKRRNLNGDWNAGRTTLTTEQQTEAIRRHHQGYGFKAIAKQFGVPKQRVRRYLIRKVNIVSRKPNTSPAFIPFGRQPKGPEDYLAAAFKEDQRQMRIGDETKHWANHPAVAEYAYRRKIMKQVARKQNDPVLRLRVNIGVALSNAMRNAGSKKQCSVMEYCGCSRDFLIEHLKSQFKGRMTIENYGKWHIDHIVPQSAFDHTDPAEIKRCWNWQNLRPMWAKANKRKNATITDGQVPLPLLAND